MQDRPQINVRITRENNRINITVGNKKIALLPVDNTTQLYDFVALEQWITRVAKYEYNKIIKRDQLEKDLASLAGDK